jgi:hypothetical protein
MSLEFSDLATDGIDRIGQEVKRKGNCNAGYWIIR